MTDGDQVERAGPDLSYEPLRSTRTTVDRAIWDSWASTASAASRTAKRSAILIATLVGCLGIAAGFLILPRELLVTVVAYAPLLAWVAGRATRRSVHRRSLRETVRQMRETLAPAEIGQFESSVLESMLISRRVAAQREGRLILIDAKPREVTLTVNEYDMSKIETWDFPVTGGGIGIG
jgi:hypothetical protein